MCPRSNKETSLKITSLPISLALDVNPDHILIESLTTTDLHINDHHLIDHYLDSLQNSDRNSMTDNSTAVSIRVFLF